MNEGNIRGLTRELLDYLDACDAEFKPDLANKVLGRCHASGALKQGPQRASAEPGRDVGCYTRSA